MKDQKLESKPEYARAIKMFQDGRPLTDVVIELDIESPTVFSYYMDYLKLVNMGEVVSICKELKHDLPLFLDLYRRIKKEGLGKQQITELLETHHLLLDLMDRVDLFNDRLEDLHTKSETGEGDRGKGKDTTHILARFERLLIDLLSIVIR
ncbi:MAG: hypothetical protein WKF36_09890 [Candidatus Nitrosocosmicus sp.]